MTTAQPTNSFLDKITSSQVMVFRKDSLNMTSTVPVNYSGAPFNFSATDYMNNYTTAQWDDRVGEDAVLKRYEDLPYEEKESAIRPYVQDTLQEFCLLNRLMKENENHGDFKISKHVR